MSSTLTLGLLGRKLGHSKSPELFEDFFKQCNLKGSYSLLEISRIEELPNLLESMPELNGFNVTVPYKVDIIPYLDHLDSLSMMTGAVNTVRVDRDKEGGVRLMGYNTDVTGFSDTLSRFRFGMEDEALVLGTGGAAKAVSTALSLKGIKHKHVSRQGAEGHLSYGNLTRHDVENAALIINATPAGMWPETESFPPFPFQWLSQRHVCYDLVYNPAVTSFMRRSAAHGAIVCNGLGMLVNQARQSWALWTGKRF